VDSYINLYESMLVERISKGPTLLVYFFGY